MGPNGSGKSTLSHVLMGRPGYEVLGGSVTLDGVDLLAARALAARRSRALPRVAVPDRGAGREPRRDADRGAARAQGRPIEGLHQRVADEAARIGFDDRFLTRPLNVDLSGGEKKRNETLQLAVLEPAFAILDELDSGLDIDALRACAQRVEAATKEGNLGVLAITHYIRLLHELPPTASTSS